MYIKVSTLVLMVIVPVALDLYDCVLGGELASTLRSPPDLEPKDPLVPFIWEYMLPNHGFLGPSRA